MQALRKLDRLDLLKLAAGPYTDLGNELASSGIAFRRGIYC